MRGIHSRTRARQKRLQWFSFLGSFSIVSAITFLNMASAQTTEAAKSFSKNAAIVLYGKVVSVRASNEPLLPAGNDTVEVKVFRMQSGANIAGDQTGKIVTVVLSKPDAMKKGQEGYFFGNPLFVGSSLTINDVGEIPTGTAAPLTFSIGSGAEARRDQLVIKQLQTASLVFRGTVQSVRPLEAVAKALYVEHDPRWQVASVSIVTPLRGGTAGGIVSVVFAGSSDIFWFNSPKPTQGQDAIFIAHLPGDESDVTQSFDTQAFAQASPQPAYMVIQPADVLPATDETRVLKLLALTAGK